MEIGFARRLSIWPLLDCLTSGIVVSIFFIISFEGRILISVLLGLIVFAIESLLIYPSNLAMLYGHWQLNNAGIVYYDYKTFGSKLTAIFLPSFEKTVQISFEQISSFKVFSPNEVSYLLKTPPTWIRRPYYLELTLKDGQTIKLDLSWDLHGYPTTVESILEAVNFMKLKTNKKATQQE